MGNRCWTDEELKYLDENWGYTSLKSMSAHLDRTIIAITDKARRLGYPEYTHSGDYITFNQLRIHLGLGKVSRSRSWIATRNLPVHYKQLKRRRIAVVYIDEWWEWAEKNQDVLDLSKLEPLILGKEPKWVEAKRLNDKIRNATIRTGLFTPDEDARLIGMLKTYRYTISQIAQALQRKEGAIKGRIATLGLKYRPVPESHHNKWTEEEVNLLHQMIAEQRDYLYMQEKLVNRNKTAIQSKISTIYGTGNLAKIYGKIL